MSTNGQLLFTDVDKITFKGVGNTSNAVVDTLTGKIGVGIDNPEANLHVLGNSYVSTNLELGGTLIMGTVNVEAYHSLEAVTATGNTTPLTVEFSNATTGIVTTGNVQVGNELTVTGNTTVSSNLTVSGNTTVSSNLTVSGNATVSSNLTVSGNATVSSNLTVSGNATVSSNLTVSGTGQTSTSSFNQAGALGSTLILKDDGSSTGNGGAIMFGANQGYFGAIKGGLDNGANNTAGRITFFTRPDWTDSTMSSAMTIKYDGKVGIGEDGPENALHIRGSNSQLLIEGEDNEDANIDFSSGPSYRNRRHQIQTEHYALSSFGYANKMHFRVNEGGENTPSIRMTVRGDGNVGIGEESPTTSLSLKKPNGGAGGVPGFNGTPSTDENYGISWRSTLNSYWNGAGVVFSTEPAINAARLYYEAKKYTQVHSSVAGIHGVLNVSVGETEAAAKIPCMSWSSSGRTGIGTEYPTKKLHVVGDAYYENVIWVGSTTWTGGNGVLQLTSSSTGYQDDAIACKPYNDGNWIIGFRNAAGNDRGKIAGVNASNVDYNTTSDERLKKQIKPMNSVLERVNNLTPCTYTWIRDEKEGYGFVAQEVYKIFPEMKTPLPTSVFTPTCDDEYDYPRNRDGTEHYYGLDYGKFTPFLAKAIQELDTKVEERHNRKSLITDISYSVIENYEGLIVSATTNKFKNGKPTLTLSNVEKDKKCYGVILGKTKSIDSETNVQRSGDGRMWVIDIHGTIESGDLVTSSTLNGYGSKQDDDLLRSYTVAKITQDCDFTQKYVPLKRVKKEMKDVTYYIQDYYVEIRHFDPYKKEDLIKREIPMYSKPCEASSPERGYERVITPFMTQDDYDKLSVEEKENYTVSYVIYKTPYEYEHLNEDEKSEYTETIKTGYYLKEVHESSKPMPECCGEYVTEIRQELVNVLDANGQIQWEDDPSGDTELEYKIKYLDANGMETDEANHVYKAAFLGCTYHCG